MEKIGLPKISEEIINDKESKFVIEPLYPGYGPTIGNSLRRVLLSSITGAAATSFKVDGITHEFSSIPNVKEDVIELIMNLKGVNFKSFSDEPVVLELIKKGPGKVVAGDIKSNSNIEIANPDHYLLSLDTKSEFRMEIVVEKNRGFRPVSMIGDEKNEIGQILIDASFSPVERVGLEISDMRVGQMTNFDKLVLNIITNGTVTPSYALKEASKVLVDHHNAIMSDENFNLEVTQKYAAAEIETPEEVSEEVEETEEEATLEGKTKIEDANFSQRTTNALLNTGIKTVAGLKRISPLKLEEIKGLGKKGIDEIKERLES